MCILLLIRHGDNDYSQSNRLPGRLPGIHLNEKGRTAVGQVAERLSQVPITAIYSSPLERTMETAELIAGTLKLDVNPREGLIEIDCGDWQGQKISNLKRLKLWKDVQNFPSHFSFPGGETFFVGQQRICQEIESICREHGPKDVLICVSHADPIKLAVADYVGIPIDLFQRLYIAPASITALKILDGDTRLLMLNYEVSFSVDKA
jgi:probable phosphomutase (TIGR03848 family)